MMYCYWIKGLLHLFIYFTLCRMSCAGVKTTACGGNPADVIFVLDSSSSIWKPDFERQLTFVQDMVDIFPISPNLTQVALVTFDSRPRVIFYFNTFKSKSRLRRRIGMVHRDPHVHTYTDRAIRIMRKVVQSERFGARYDDPKVTQVAIIITDGLSTNTTATALEAAKAREDGVHIFAIGVGDNVDQAELENIASSPYEQYVHRVHNYEGLNSIKELLAIKTCTVTDAPTTLPTTTIFTTTTLPTTRSTTTPVPTTSTTSATTTTATKTTTERTPVPTTTSTVKTTRPTTTPKPTTTSRIPTTTTTTTTIQPSTTTKPTTPTATTASTTPSTTAQAKSTTTLHTFIITSPSQRQSTSPQIEIDSNVGKKIDYRSSTPAHDEGPPEFVVPEPGTDEFILVNTQNEIDPDPETTTKPPVPLLKPPFDPDGINRVCVFDEPTDIVFVIDEKQGGPHTMNNIWKFIKDLLNYVDMSNGNLNVKFIYECLDIPDVQLGSYRNKTALLSALSHLTRNPRSTADLLQHMSYRLLGSDINSIEPHHKIGVYITDGPSGNISATLIEAQTAKLLHNIELFGVGIGKDIDPTELRALVSCEVDEHLHMVIKPRDLDDVVHPVIKELCKVRTHKSRHSGFK